ncbi:olfactory receptor 1C1-like [Pseudophryne corroboree]|uniref:olfactory receptor 1C1-like n=1 Tax=Pseudophryne corroboree TaxID=495146 RepID=UPI003081DD82
MDPCCQCLLSGPTDFVNLLTLDQPKVYVLEYIENITIPKLLYMILSGNYTVSFIQCFTQVYFCDAFASTEVILLSVMAYDRYVAVCKPLHYHPTSVSFCYSNIIHQYFCDIKSLMENASSDKEVFIIVIYLELLVLGFGPFFCSLLSYIVIISTIIQIKSRYGQRKAFSTCSFHLMVLTIFYGTATCVFMMPPTDQYRVIELIFTVQYTVVTPMLNPLIYSLQNKAVKRAIKRSIGIK